MTSWHAFMACCNRSNDGTALVHMPPEVLINIDGTRSENIGWFSPPHGARSEWTTGEGYLLWKIGIPESWQFWSTECASGAPT